MDLVLLTLLPQRYYQSWGIYYSGTDAGAISAWGTDLTDAKNADEINSDNLIIDITKISVEEFTNVIEKIADVRAENGAGSNESISR